MLYFVYDFDDDDDDDDDDDNNNNNNNNKQKQKKRLEAGYSIEYITHAGHLIASICFALCDPLTLTFQPQIIKLVGYPKIIPHNKFEHFGIICF